MKLSKLLNDWQDYDIAQYYLACSIGIMKYENSFEEYRKAKGVFWTNNKAGNMLYEILEKRSRAGC